MGRLLVRGWREFAIVMQDRISPDIPHWGGLVTAVFALSLSGWVAVTEGSLWPLAMGGGLAVMGLGLWWPLNRRGGPD